MLYETEPGYDQVVVEYLTKSGNWQTERQFSGYQAFLDTITVPADSLDGSVRFRFGFTSDGAWSDEDGMWATDGAMIIDSITVSDMTGVIDFQDFETEPLGARTSADGDWSASVPPPYGDFSGLFSGLLVLQEDPGVTNISTLWGFFGGSTYDYSCGGHPEQPAVPLGENIEGAMKYLWHEIWSPRIDFTHDKDGTPVPTSAEEVLYEFDIYGDAPQDNLVAYNFIVRSWIGGCPGRWSNFSSFEFAASKLWIHKTLSVGSLLSNGTEEIQVGVMVVDTCPFWCNIFGSGDCHSHGPLFDDFKVSRILVTATGIPDVPQYKNELAQNAPNPFNPTTTVRYSIREPGHVSLRIYNVTGQLVRTLVDEGQVPRPEGFAVVWDGCSNAGQSVSSGIYFYRLEAPSFTSTRKMVMIK